MPAFSSAVPVVDLHALDVLHRDHAARAVLVQDLRDPHRRVVGEESADPFGALRFAPKIELHLQVPLQFVEQRQEVHRIRVEALVDGRHAPRRREIGADDVFDVGVLDFDGDLATVEQPRAMHLRERRGGNRRRRELAEYLLQRPAEVFLDDALDGLKIARRQAVVALRQRLDVLRREHIGARADDLAHLHQHAAHRDGRVEDLIGVALMDRGPCRASKDRGAAADPTTCGDL